MEFPEELDISLVLNVLYFYEYRVEIEDTIESKLTRQIGTSKSIRQKILKKCLTKKVLDMHNEMHKKYLVMWKDRDIEKSTFIFQDEYKKITRRK